MTLDCLRSLAQSTWSHQFVVVVDNASSDGSVDAVRREFPDVSTIVNEANLGYAEGNNVGIQVALERGADLVLLLNNDTIVDPEAIGAMVDELRRRPDAGAVSPLIYFADPPDRIWFAGADFDPSRGYPGRMLGYGQRDVGQFSSVRHVDRLTGAAMMVSRSTIERTGVLDGSLFFLYEDVDWSLRMRRAGLRLYVIPAAKVWHRVAASQGGEHSSRSTYYGLRNQLVVSARHARLGRLGSLRRMMMAFIVYAGRLRHARRPWRHLPALVGGLLDAHRGRLGAWNGGAEAGRRGGHP